MTSVLQLGVSDSGFGGANIAALRLHKSLLAFSKLSGISSQFRVLDRRIDDPSIIGGLPARHVFWNTHIRPRLIRLRKKRFHLRSPGFYSIGWPFTGLGAELESLHSTGGFDILHCHALDNAMLSIEELAKFTWPIVWTLHDQWAFSGGEHYSDPSEPFVSGYTAKPPDTEPAVHALNRWVWERKARAWTRPMNLVAPTHWMADCARRSALMGQWPCRVIPNPIDLTCWAPVDQRQARALLNLPLDSPLLLFGATGGITDHRKGGGLLLEALHLLCGSTGVAGLEDLQLAVFGQSQPDTAFTPPLPIHYLGRISDELHLRLLYAAADVFVIPSRQDNLPNTGLEAHACGTPVVAFRTCGLVDIVEEGVTGALAEPFEPLALAQAIRWVLHDPQRRSALGQAARRRAETLWAPRRVAGLHTDLYREVLERHSQP